MKKRVGRIILWIVFCVLVVILVILAPAVIARAFPEHGKPTQWKAPDMLGYFGVLLGAFATMAAVLLTIRFENHKQWITHYEKKAEDKVSFVRAQLYPVLQTLDATPLTAMNIDFNDPAPTIYSLQRYIAEINRLNYLELLFEKEIRSTIADTLDDIKTYVAGYSPLVQKIVDSYRRYFDNQIYRTLTQLLENLNSLPEPNQAEIQEVVAQIENTPFVDYQIIQAESYAYYQEVHAFHNSHYPQLLDAIISTIPTLEQHFEEQLTAEKRRL